VYGTETVKEQNKSSIVKKLLEILRGSGRGISCDRRNFLYDLRVAVVRLPLVKRAANPSATTAIGYSNCYR